ncbi:hypothetical protein [Halosimplex pelagicum]|uniref:Right-handed parallel beta-helix repeat-containing protein n=1 Tax=Halosimplex pelagicum TaxID=869886 RepID=A0A7D5TG95_9EURY|nr:hypothetical protein [Halosimplex pelagicum]QLH81316.1 hypothetical protein HZS54_06590 [Halosimplex pelagicum]
MDDDTFSRRQFLRIGGLASAVGLAGCSNLVEETTATPPDVDDSSDVDPLVPTDTPTAAETSAPAQKTDTQAQNQETDTPTPSPEPQPPEPRFVVAEDGSGDYKTLEDARRVSEPNDVVSLKPGSYTLKPKQGDSGLHVKKPLTLVGDSRDSTTVTVAPESNELSFTESYEFWHLTVTSQENSYFYTDGGITANYARYEVPTQGWKGGGSYGGSLNAYKTIINPPTIDKETVSGVRQFLADAPIWTGGLNVENCTVKVPIHVDRLQAQGTTFEAQPELPDSGGTVQDSTFENGIALLADSGSGLSISNSELHPDADGFAFRIPEASGSYSTSQPLRYNGPTIRDSTIHGKIEDKKRRDVWKSLRTLEGNVFRADEIDAEFFIDGKGADYIHRNAFIGADIRIDASGEGLRQKAHVYDEERKIGNYYSAFDKEDEDGDGIIDLPRPVPGEASATDQFPLASKDLSQHSE